MAKDDIPPTELSMKYIAWNIKQIDINIKRMADAFEEIVRLLKNGASKDSLPF
jgi:hypothetical protein